MIRPTIYLEGRAHIAGKHKFLRAAVIGQEYKSHGITMFKGELRPTDREKWKPFQKKVGYAHEMEQIRHRGPPAEPLHPRQGQGGSTHTAQEGSS